MQSLFRSLVTPLHYRHQHHRTLVDFASIKHVRDRGLDHAVEREKHLKPVLNIKNFIKAEPSKSLPISIISQHKESLNIPTRPIEFIRRYPSIFEEFLPGGIGILPHIKLTPQVLDLDAEEQLVYQSESYRQDAANRLLKLLMISRIHKIPLKTLDFIKWDLGLPQDFVKKVVPEFPDSFRVIGGGDLLPELMSDSELELVCWSNELAVPVTEKKAKNRELGNEKGLPIAFPMQFSRGFEMDQKFKKWLGEWQKLPYVSPYENATHLGPSTDESDKWTVGILHEVLNLFVSKKVERDTLLCLGEWLGIRSRFKRALLHHPGIFYLSSKMGTFTVVLKEAYKRGLVVEKSPLMDIRNQYIHLMNTVEDRKVINVPAGSKKEEKKTPHESQGQGEKEDGKDSAEVDDIGSDFEDDSDDEYESGDNDEETGHANKQRASGNVSACGRRADKKNLDVKGPSRNAGREKSDEKHHFKATDKVPSRGNSRTEIHKGHNFRGGGTSGMRGPSGNAGRESSHEKYRIKAKDKVPSRDNGRKVIHEGRHMQGNKYLDVRSPSRNAGRELSVEKRHSKTNDKVRSRDTRRTEVHNFHGSKNLGLKGSTRNAGREKSGVKRNGLD